MVSGLDIDEAFIDKELARRQSGFGRGDRMKIEKDAVEILSGVRKGQTIGSPIALMIKNKDFTIGSLSVVTCPRPGHADLCGAIKYNRNDIRDVLERSSARETAVRVAVGAVCKLLLAEFDISIKSHVLEIGGVGVGPCLSSVALAKEGARPSQGDHRGSPLQMTERIASARKRGDTVGGIFEVNAIGIPVGLGSYAQPNRRLSARLVAALMSIPAIKGVEIGLGFESAKRFGSEVHDVIFYNKSRGFYRKTNNAGGIEGGVSNGQPVVIRCAMKPISTLMQPLASVNIKTKKSQKATVERSDICAVFAAAVVGEAVCAFELAGAILEKFGGDSFGETKRNYEGYIKQIRKF
jgi:chorismate synthase